MKRFALILLALTLAVPALAGPDHPGSEHPRKTDAAWFDMENCDFCKHWQAEPGLMEHVTWENHIIANGALTITRVEPEYAAAYERANAEMHALGEKMMTGKVDPTRVKMCGHCSTFGQLMMAGARMEMIKGEQTHVDVALVTSDDPAMVAKIHEFTRKNNAEMKKMSAEDHSGHGHGDHPHGNH